MPILDIPPDLVAPSGPTLGTQRRRATASGGRLVYETETWVTYQGDLPDVGVFTYRIADPADPTTDVLMRVATPADLVTWGADRWAAVDAGEGYFRQGYLLRQFTDVRAATQDAQVVQELVDLLVTTWATYQDEFTTEALVGGVEDLSWPLPDATLLEGLVATYDEAVTARAAKAEELVDKATEVTAAAARAAELDADVLALTAAADQASAVSDTLTNSLAGFVLFSTDAAAFAANVEGGTDVYQDTATASDPAWAWFKAEGIVPLAKADFDASIASAAAYIAEMRRQTANASDVYAALAAQVVSRTSALTVARQTLATASTEKITLQYELNALTAEVAAATAAVLAVDSGYSFT